MFRDGEGVDPEEYARKAYESFIEEEDGQVRREFFRDYANSFYDRHGTWPAEEDFVNHLVELHERLDSDLSRMEVEAEELLEEAREKPPVCPECLKMMEYTGWLETGMREWEDGRPYMEPVEAKVYTEAPDGLEHLDADGKVTVEIRYRCVKKHDTGFSEYRILEDEQFMEMMDELEEGDDAVDFLGIEED